MTSFRSKAPKESAVLYVGHLAPEFREKELEGYFGQFGPIIRCRLSRSKKTGNRHVQKCWL